MDAPPPEPRSSHTLAYSNDRPRRPTMHLWIGATLAMLLEVPWAYIVGTMLSSGMSNDAELLSLRGVTSLAAMSLPSLLAAVLVMLAVRRSS